MGVQAFESGSVISVPHSPGFPQVAPELTQRVEKWPIRGWGLKNPTWDPMTRELHPKDLVHQPEAGTFVEFLHSFQQAAEKTLIQAMPHWKGALVRDRVSWRPWELATRRLRWNARDDFFHIDHFPRRPSLGRRLVRVFMNAGQADDIVWASTKPLDQLLEDGRRYGQPEVFRDLGAIRIEAKRNKSWWGRTDQSASLHDAVYKAIHDGLKRDEKFQEETIRKIHHFPPGAVWMAMTDLCCHSFLRGGWLVDATWFVPVEYCVHQQIAPAQLLGTITAVPRPINEHFEKAA